MPSADELTTATVRILRAFEMPPEVLGSQVVLTPACGLAGWSVASAARLLTNLQQAGGLVTEQLAG